MKLRYLPIVPLLVLNTAYAQQSGLTATPVSYDDNSIPAEYTLPATAPTNELRAGAVTLNMPYSGPARVNPLYGGIQVGHGIVTAKTDTIDFSGGGTPFRFDIGVRFRFGQAYDDNRGYFLTLALAIGGMNAKGKYDQAGTERNTESKFTVLSLPFSYYYVNNLSRVGYYVQAGMNLNYNVSAKPDRYAPIGEFTKIWIEPNASFGFSFDYKYRGEMAHALLGPYVGYSVNNIAAVKGAEMRFLSIGLKYTAYFK